MYKKGYHHTEEEKEKIRQGKLGAKNPNFGKKLSLATRQKMSQSRIGKPHKIPHEAHVRQSESLKAFYATPEGEALKEKLRNLTAGTKIHLGYRHTFSEEFKVKRKQFMKDVWARGEEYKNQRVHNILAAGNILPNKPEKTIISILEELAINGWEYTGDGSFNLAGKNPDFLNAERKQLIEHYGTHWHRGHNPQDRIDLFKKYGYDTLIIWEDELSNIDNVKQKIIEFTQKELVGGQNHRG